MTKAPPPRVPLTQLAYLLVFGIFVFVYLARVLIGTAIAADWVILGVATFLLIITVYRVILKLGKPDA
jgi:hypothetical protein